MDLNPVDRLADRGGVGRSELVADPAEHAYFSDSVKTYGKTFHTWQYDRDDFPYGIPQLMMGLTEGRTVQTRLEEMDFHR